MRVIRGKFSEYKDKIQNLLKDHWQEIGMAGTQDLSLNINYSAFEFAEKAGTMECFGIEDAGELIGYLVAMIYNHPHHAHVKFAMTDVFYIKKDRRNAKTFRYALWMFKAAEKCLRLEHGVQYFQLIYSKNNNLGNFAKALGFVESDVFCIKKL